MIKSKWGAGALSVALVTSIFVFPSMTEAKMDKKGTTSANSTRSLSELKQQVKQQQKWLKSNGIQRNTPKESVQEAQFKGKLDWYQNHTYRIVVEKDGVLQINEKNSNDKVKYTLMNTTSFEEVSNGAKVPTGEYFLSVWYDQDLPPSENDVSYEVKVSGISMNSVDNTVPELQTNAPTKHELRLTTEAKNFSLKGSVKGADRVDITANSTSYGLRGFIYSEALPLNPGNNSYQITAREMSGNMANELFEVVKPHLQRYNGLNPAGISAQLSKQRYPSGAETVVIANSHFGSEALTAPALSSVTNAPILLTDANQLPAAVSTEIKRLGPSKAIILGDDKIVSKAVEEQLKKMNIQIDRQAGSNPFISTSQMAEKILKENEIDSVAIVEASDFASAMYMSAGYSSPILLVEKDRIPVETKSVLKKYPQIKNLLVVGPKGQISEAVKKQLGSYGKVMEVTGKDRLEVGVNVIRHFSKMNEAEVSEFVIVKDQDYASSLLGGGFYTPILFAPTHSLDKSVSTYLSENKPNVIYLLGGKEVISMQVERQLKEKLN
ncbi:putative cell wall-binding protein [Croceifilum oryzae]|uniref:Cell wall-binding protein n=1 Tax=Croceifilum oryzae TaxID=1553429 RepID=A0AAJ1TJ95_9BACL|nr:cell wall-binding repeat-containing protein [Croceifilum oryzae]MDQ0417952.1 putative cell wall-binding protein [Croceifilum oryzae]